MNAMLLPCIADFKRLSEEIRSFAATADSAQWQSLWNRRADLPPLLAIEAMSLFPVEWEPVDQAQANLFKNIASACRNVSLDDFEQLGRCRDECISFPKKRGSLQLEGSPDGRWILQTTNSELRVLEPGTFHTREIIEFKSNDGVNATPRCAISGDSKLAAVISHASKDSFRVSTISLETLRPISTRTFNSSVSPSFAFRPNSRKLLIVGLKPHSNNDAGKNKVQTDSIQSRMAQLFAADYENSDPESENVGAAIELDLESGEWVAFSLVEQSGENDHERMPDIGFPQRMAISSTGDKIATCVAILEGHCALQVVYDIRVYDLAAMRCVNRQLIDDQILDLKFIARGRYLILETRHELKVWCTESWKLVRTYEMASTQDRYESARSAESADGTLWAVAQERQLHVESLPSLETLSVIHLGGLQIPFSRSDSAFYIEAVSFCGNRIIAEMDRGIFSLAVGMGQKTWPHVSELRRISCTPINQQSQTQKQLLMDASSEAWLTVCQRRWLAAVKSFIPLALQG